MRRLIPFFLCFALAGCGPQIDCEKLARKLKECRQETYSAVAPPPAELLDHLASSSSPLDESARRQISEQWRERKKKLASEAARSLAQKCRRHEGRYREAEAINECLELTDCGEFAACFRKAVHVSNLGAAPSKTADSPPAEPEEPARPTR